MVKVKLTPEIEVDSEVDNDVILIKYIDCLQQAKEIAKRMNIAGVKYYKEYGYHLLQIIDKTKEVRELDTKISEEVLYEYTLGIKDTGLCHILVGANNTTAPDKIKIEVQQWCQTNKIQILNIESYGTLLTLAQHTVYNRLKKEANAHRDRHLVTDLKLSQFCLDADNLDQHDYEVEMIDFWEWLDH